MKNWGIFKNLLNTFLLINLNEKIIYRLVSDSIMGKNFGLSNQRVSVVIVDLQNVDTVMSMKMKMISQNEKRY